MERFTALQRTILLATARHALAECLVHGQAAPAAAEAAVSAALESAPARVGDPLLLEAACFVTLWQSRPHSLRGCRGEFTAHQPLLAAVAQMALAAALDDPRFTPLTGAELPSVRIEINVLTPLSPISPLDIELGLHGLLIERRSRRGLLLPQVPIEHHMTRPEFLDAVCAKAGLPDDAWRDAETRLWSFETEAWEEP